MTLTIASIRDSFVVLAGDGLWTPSGDDERKTLWCSSCPLACTVSGCRVIPQIKGILDTIITINEGTFNHIADQLSATLEPILKSMPGTHVGCHVALVSNDKAELGWVRVGHGRERIPPPDGWLRQVVPDEVNNVVEPLLGAVHSAHVNHAEHLADLMLCVVNGAIAQDRRQHQGAHIGGTANAVIVTKGSARPYPA